MQPDQTLGIVHADCLRTISNIGNTVVQNICTGTSTTVPWGSGDWLGFWVLSGLGIAFGIVVLVLIVMMLSNLWPW